MRLDFEEKSVSLKAQFVEKFLQRLKWMEGHPLVWGEFRSVFGMFLYASYVLAVPLATVYHLLKWYARNVFNHQSKTNGASKFSS